MVNQKKFLDKVEDKPYFMNNFREKYSNWFRFNEELRVIIEPSLNKHHRPKNLKQNFLLYAMTKSHKTQAAILLLCENGFGQDAGILSRSIFESMITTLYIFKDNTEERVKRFFDYDSIMCNKMYKNVKNAEMIQKKLQPELQEKIEEINQKYSGMKESNNWSDNTFKKMANEVGWLDAYKNIYCIQCSLSHPNPRNTNDYLSASEKMFVANAGPDDKLIFLSLFSTFDFFIRIIYVWDKEFNFGLEHKLSILEEQYLEQVRKINKENESTDKLMMSKLEQM